MQERIDSRKEFTLMRRARSFAHAGRGIWVFLRSTPNAWLQLVLFGGALALGILFHISRTEWALLTFAGGLVLAAEAFNTAIEIDMNLTSPEYHPYARDTKDVAAGAVLISAVAAAVVGALVFVPYILKIM